MADTPTAPKNPRNTTAITRHALWFFFLVLFLYLAVQGGHIYSGDGLIMLRVTEAMVDRSEFAVRPIQGFEDYGVMKGRDGKRYAKYGIGLSLAGIPLYVAGDAIGRSMSPADLRAFSYPDLLYYDRDDTHEVMTAFITSLTNPIIVAGLGAVLLALLLRLGFPMIPAFLAALLFSLGSPVPFFAKTFFSEPLAALGLLGSLYYLIRYQKRPLSRYLAYSGAAFGVAVLARIASIFVVPALLVALWLIAREGKPKKGVLTVFGVWLAPTALFGAVVAAYNQIRFLNPFETGYGSEAGRFTSSFFEGLCGLL
ncbi:MAG: hypothetical protein GXP54_04515, partial [Deltaproteobacteria bacterium]|nr:hypothetical protein [Deltaproteobacteria bacterium]